MSKLKNGERTLVAVTTSDGVHQTLKIARHKDSFTLSLFEASIDRVEKNEMTMIPAKRIEFPDHAGHLIAQSLGAR